MGPEMTKPRRMASTNLGLFLASTALLFATNLPLASAVCEDLEAACEEDDVCLGCLTYSQTAEDINTTECRERYPGIWSIGGEGYTAAFCESTGGRYCCDFEDNDAAETCMNNTAAASYWSCLMDDAGCEVEEMPCYSGADITPVVTTPTPAPTTSTGEPTSSSSPSSSSTIAPSLTSSNSPSSLPQCEAEIAECENDATCLECTASTSTTHNGYTAECEARYPNNFNYASEGGTWSYCSTQGAYFCCEFETNVFAATCMANAVTASYWGCLLAVEDCSVDDMPCYGWVTPAPAVIIPTPQPSVTLSPTPVATTDPSAADSDGATPSPAGDTPATVDADADSNGAARVGAPSSVMVLGCAAWLLAAVV